MPRRRFYSALVFSMILFVLTAVALATPASAERKEETQQERIDRINREIAEKGGHWTAGKTTVGSLPYEQRQKMNGFIPPTAEEWEQMPLRVLAETADLPVYFIKIVGMHDHLFDDKVNRIVFKNDVYIMIFEKLQFDSFYLFIDGFYLPDGISGGHDFFAVVF